MKHKFTMRDDTDVAPRLVHTSAFVPCVSDGVVTAHRVEVVAAVETPDHVDEVIQRAEAVVRAGG